MNVQSATGISGLIGQMIGAVGLVLIGSAAAMAQDEMSARPAKTMLVEERSTVMERTYPATVLPSEEATLTFKVSGRIIELPIRAAEQVEEGTLIARLDPIDFEANVRQLESQVAQAEAQLAAMESGSRAEEIAALEAALAAAKAQAQQAQIEVDRSRQLLESDTIAKTRLEQDETELEVAEANVRTAEENLAQGLAGAREEDIAAQNAAIRALNAQLDVAESALNDATLTAPFDGIIAIRYVDNFTNITAGSPVVELQQLTSLDMDFDVPGPDVIRFDAEREYQTWALFDELPGEEFEAVLKEFQTAASDTTQTFRGRVTFTPPDSRSILPGMVGSVTFRQEAEEPGGYKVPAGAVASKPDGSAFVWIVGEGNTVTPRDVTLGEAEDEFLLVVDGLEAGDRIVTAGVSRLQEGMTIRPVEKIGG